MTPRVERVRDGKRDRCVAPRADVCSHFRTDTAPRCTALPFRSNGAAEEEDDEMRCGARRARGKEGPSERDDHTTPLASPPAASSPSLPLYRDGGGRETKLTFRIRAPGAMPMICLR